MLSATWTETRADIGILAGGGLDHGAVAGLTAGIEAEIRVATETEPGAGAEVAVVTGGRIIEESEAGAATETLRGDTGAEAEAGNEIRMIGDLRGGTERKHCHQSHGL